MTETSAVRGNLELASVGGRTVVTRACAGNPLKLLLPRPREHAAWVYTSSFGGGLVAAIFEGDAGCGSCVASTIVVLRRRIPPVSPLRATRAKSG